LLGDLDAGLWLRDGRRSVRVVVGLLGGLLRRRVGDVHRAADRRLRL
jgi:hypothetical protein